MHRKHCLEKPSTVTQQRSKTALKPCIIPIPDRVPGKLGISLKESRYDLRLAAFYPHALCTSYFCSNIMNNPGHIPSTNIFLIILIIRMCLWVNKISFLYTLGFPRRFAQVVHWHYSRNIGLMDSNFTVVSRFWPYSSCGNSPQPRRTKCHHYFDWCSFVVYFEIRKEEEFPKFFSNLLINVYV